MAELMVLAGPPGAGKTTVSRVLSGLFEHSAHVTGDDFFGFIVRGYLAPWTPEAHRQNEIVGSAAAAAAGRLAAGGYTVVYDGVVVPELVDVFGRAAGLTHVHYAMLLPPEQVCLQRIRSRVGHGFTDLDAAMRMYAEFASAEVDRRYVITGPDDASSLAARLERLVQDGSILWPIKLQPTSPS